MAFPCMNLAVCSVMGEGGGEWYDMVKHITTRRNRPAALEIKTNGYSMAENRTKTLPSPQVPGELLGVIQKYGEQNKSTCCSTVCLSGCSAWRSWKQCLGAEGRTWGPCRQRSAGIFFDLLCDNLWPAWLNLLQISETSANYARARNRVNWGSTLTPCECVRLRRAWHYSWDAFVLPRYLLPLGITRRRWITGLRQSCERSVKTSFETQGKLLWIRYPF